MTKTIDLAVKFACVDKQVVMTRGDCYVAHREANAFLDRSAACFKCPLGDNLRLAFAGRPTLPLRPRRKWAPSDAPRRSAQATQELETECSDLDLEEQTQPET